MTIWKENVQMRERPSICVWAVNISGKNIYWSSSLSLNWINYHAGGKQMKDRALAEGKYFKFEYLKDMQ